MGRVIQLQRRIIEPFRLDGQADQVAGKRTHGLLATCSDLDVVRRHRREQDSKYLQQLEAMLERRMAKQEAFVEALDEIFSVAQMVAPNILDELAVGERGTLVIIREDRRRGAAFGCTSRGAVLVADTLALLPNRPKLRLR